jgi:hypothetical protein
VAAARLRSWVRHFMRAGIPILAGTAQALEDLRAREDDIGPGDLGPVLRADPLMTVKFFAHVATLRRDEEATETESITSALVMTGITPFFADSASPRWRIACVSSPKPSRPVRGAAAQRARRAFRHGFCGAPQ